MIEAFETSDAVHGIEGGIDSCNPATFPKAQRLLQSLCDDHLEESLDEDDAGYHTPNDQSTLNETVKKKRKRVDARSSFTSPPAATNKLDEMRNKFIEKEIEKVELERELIKYQIKRTKLEIFILQKQFCADEYRQAMQITVNDE